MRPEDRHTASDVDTKEVGQERVDEYEENDNALLIKIFRNKPEKNKTEQRGAYYQGDFNLDDAEDRDEKCGHNGQGRFYERKRLRGVQRGGQLHILGVFYGRLVRLEIFVEPVSQFIERTLPPFFGKQFIDGFL